MLYLNDPRFVTNQQMAEYDDTGRTPPHIPPSLVALVLLLPRVLMEVDFDGKLIEMLRRLSHLFVAPRGWVYQTSFFLRVFSTVQVPYTFRIRMKKVSFVSVT